jgi:DNA-binding PadR family transcriptional regulator
MPLKRLVELNTKECLWIYILKLLTEKPMHAYAIRSLIEERFGFRPGTVTAYKVLYLLNRSGLVDKSTNGRQKIYSITQGGSDSLKKAISYYKERVKLLEK